jgi:hypothetical protein
MLWVDMSRLSSVELAQMRTLATTGHVPSWGGIDEEREADPVIPLRRSEIAEYQRALLRAIDEIERCYERLRATSNVDLLASFSDDERAVCGSCKEKACVSFPEAYTSFCLACGAITLHGVRIDVGRRFTL